MERFGARGRRVWIVGIVVALASLAIACGGGLQVDHSVAVVEELKWGPGRSPGQIPSTGPVPDGCARIDGGQIGQKVTVGLSGLTLTFNEWIPKVDERGQYVGFAFVASGSVAYAVKAGLETFYGSASPWTHPAGLSGSDAKAIGNITFCPGAAGGGGSIGVGGGTACAANGDCWSGECEAATHLCSRGGAGTHCEIGARDCVSGICSNGSCAPNPTGKRGDPCTVDANCWSGPCLPNLTCEGGHEGGRCRPTSDDCMLGLVCGPADTCVKL